MTPNDSNPSILGPNQRRLVGFTVSFACLLGVIFLFSLTIAILGRLVSTFSSMLWPLAVAGILALMLRPLVLRVQQRLNVSALTAVLLLYGLLVLMGIGLLAWLLPVIIAQVRDFIVLVPQLVSQGIEWLQQNLPVWAEAFRDQSAQHAAWQEHLQKALDRLGDGLLNAAPGIAAAGGMLLGVFGLAAGLAIIPVYLFFFLQSQRDPTESLHGALPFLKPETRNDVVFLAREFVSMVVAFFRGQLLIALICGVLLAIGFTAVGLRFSILLGLTLGLLNIIPYLGVILGVVTTIPLAFLQPGGGWVLALLVAAVFALVQVLESTVLTPRIMGNQTGLHPVVIIIAIFFWGIALGGLLGMILAIPLTAFFVTAWRLAKRKYIREIA